MWDRIQFIWWRRLAWGWGRWPKDRPWHIFRFLNLGPLEVRLLRKL